MRRMSDPDFVYRPWSEERRQAAILAAEIRHYGSPEQARKTRKRRLRALLKRRDELASELAIVRSNIAHLKRLLQ